MKIKKIAALCSRAGVFHLSDKVDREGVVTQWLGEGGAFYPLLDAPMLDENSLCTIFDIAGKKRDNIIFRCDEMPEQIDTRDINDGDIRLEPEKLSICCEGTTILPLRGANRVICIQEKYLEPLNDEKELLELYRRTTAHDTYVVVKIGMMIRAIISPYQMAGDLADKLAVIASECKEKLAGKECGNGGSAVLFVANPEEETI